MNELLGLLAGMVAGLTALLIGQLLVSITRNLVTIIIEAFWPPKAIDIGSTNLIKAPSKLKEPR